MDQKYQAIVLVGPTGSGKTPLGALFEKQGFIGFIGQRCVHFDFGENLRQVVTRSEPDEIVSAEDIDFLRGVLETGALLEDEDYPIARRLLLSFLRRRRADQDTIVVMNGLPRHVGQARALASTLDVRHLIVLECSAKVVLERIASNAGGDRTERADDDEAATERKLEIFSRRTAPLVDYFRELGVDILTVKVTPVMTAEEMWSRLRIGLKVE